MQYITILFLSFPSRVLLLFIFSILSITTSAQKGEQYFLAANEKCTLGKYKDAVELYTKAIATEKDNAKYYLFRGRACMKAVQTDQAFADFSQAIRLNREYSEAYLERGVFFYYAQENDKSILDLSEGLKFAKDDSLKINLWVALSGGHLHKMSYDACVEDCKNILAIDSLNVAAFNNMAMALDGLGNAELALFYLKKITQVDSTVPYSYMNIGFYLSQHGKYKESLPYFDQALKYKGDESYILNNRGYSKMMLNDFDGALKDINKSIKMNQGNSYAFKNRGQVYLLQGKNEKACEDLHQAVSLGFTKVYGKEVEDLIKKNCLQ